MKQTRMICLIGLIALPALAAPPTPDPVAVAPFPDVAMRSPSIGRGPDGTFYLTGTTGDGVSLWKSADLKKWDALGQVWPGKGLTSPKIHFVKGAFYIPYSRNGFGCGLLKSTSGKAEGPYEDMGSITPEGASLSLFQDEDPPSPGGSGAAGGAVYMVLDEGWIARMKDDLSGPAEPPRLVVPRSGSDLGNAPFTVGRSGAFLFKRNGVYYLCAAEWTSRTGYPVHDNYVASARNVYGPYDCRHLMVAHGGETTVFEAGDGQWFATMGGDDVRAKSRDRPALVPLAWGKDDIYWTRGIPDEFPSKPKHIITERGPWEKCRPLTEDIIRDVEVMLHSDGYVYYTGSCLTESFNNQVVLWRFKADDIAKVGRGEGHAEAKAVMHFKDLHWLDYENRLKYGKGKTGYGLVACSMDADVFFLKGTFYMTFNLYGAPGLEKNPTLDGGKTSTAGSGVIRSTSGTWDGPWESVGRVPYAHCSLREDEQGRIVTQRGWRGVMALQDDGTFAPVKDEGGSPVIGYPPDGTAFCDDGSGLGGVGFDPVFKTWRWSSTEWNGVSSLHIEQRPGATYDMSFSWSESGKEEGPYPRRMNTLPHCGGAAQFRDGKGRYWSTLFGNDSTGPWSCRMGVIPLKVRKEGSQHLIDIADEWPED